MLHYFFAKEETFALVSFFSPFPGMQFFCFCTLVLRVV